MNGYRNCWLGLQAAFKSELHLAGWLREEPGVQAMDLRSAPLSMAAASVVFIAIADGKVRALHLHEITLEDDTLSVPPTHLTAACL